MSLKHSARALVLALWALSSQAQALDGSLATDYVQTFEKADPYYYLNLGLNQNVTESSRFFLNQGVQKNIVIDSETPEMDPVDTAIGFDLSTRAKKRLSYGLSLSATLPLSKKSQEDEVVTRLSLSPRLSFQFHKMMSVSAGAFASYYWNRYESAKSYEGEGGMPLPQYGYGLNQGANLKIGGPLSLFYKFAYRETKYHDVAYTGPAAVSLDKRPTQGYSLDVGFDCDLWTQASAGAGFSQGTVLEQEGWLDYVFFDENTSSWSLSFSQSF